MLLVTDPDNTPEQIVYRIEKSPTNGAFKLNASPTGLYGSFTQKDINDGKVSFQHDGSEDFIDIDVTFSVSDGTNLLKNQKFKLDVIPQNDNPILTVGTTVSLAEDTEQVITTANFNLSDIDGSGEKIGQGFATTNSLTFKVTELPVNGDLYVDQGSGYVKIDASNFGTLIITNNQLTSNKLKYVHGGDENVADSFKVQALDDSGALNNFSPIQTINIEIAKINDAPEPSTPVVNLVVSEAGTGTIKGSNALIGEPRLVYTDPDNSTIQRQYAITSKTTRGAILLNGKTLAVGSVFTQDDLDNNRVTYKHDGTEFYTDSFNFEVRDGAAPPVPGSYGITITPTNDSPTLTVPATQTFATTAPLVFSTANSNAITFTDPDLVALDVGEIDIIRVTLDLQTAGATYTNSTLTLGSTTGVTVSTGTNGVAGGKIVFEGKKADIQAALEGLQVQVPADEDRIVSLVVTVDDRNNGGPDALIPQPTTVTKTININASNVNDAPTIPTTPASVSVSEDTTLNFTGANAIAIQDVDSFSTTNNTVTLSVNQGTLNLTPGAAIISGGANGTGTITLTGSLANINAAIASLSYKGNPEYNGSDNLSVVFNDAGNLGTGGAQSVTQNIPITVTPVNDAPTIAAPSSTLAIEDGNPLTFNGANLISIDDAKDLGSNGNGLDTFTVTVEALNGAAPYGSVQVATGSGATIINDNTASVTISGTKAQVNAALNGLSYTPANSNVDATVALKVTARDQANGGTAIGGTGGELTDIKTVLINVSGVNDAPVLTAPTSVIATEDIQFTFAANSLRVDDPDDFGKLLQVSLSVGIGNKLTLGSLAGLTIVSGADNTSTVTIKGTESAINTALNTLKYQGNADYNTLGGSKDTLIILVDDLGNSGTGGAKTTTKTVDITVTPINDAPVVPGSASVVVVPVAEDLTNPAGINTFTLLNSKYSDIKDTVSGGSTATPLAGIAIYSNNAVAAQGKWQYNTSGSWIDIPTSVGTSSALVLPATADLRFLPNANFNGAPGNLRVYLSDGTGGLPATGSLSNVSAANRGNANQWSNNPVSITTTITAVNDAPIATGIASLATIDEDATNPPGATVASLFTPTFSDTIDTVAGGSTANTLAGVAIIDNAATAAQGTWQYFNGTSWVAIANPTPSAALVIAAGTGLRFLPNADFNGTPGGLTVKLIDSSGTATTGNILDLTALGTGGITPYSSGTIPLTTSVTSVNDAPNGADNVKTIAEDTSYTFAAIDFGFSNPADPTDTLSAVKISSLPSNGKLQLNGVDITVANVVVSLTDINSSKLKFVPDLDENGAPYGNFTFAVRDNSGIIATEFDATPNTFTFNVTPVDDAPTGQDKTITTLEDTNYVLAIADFGFADVDGDTFSSVRIDTLPTNGTLKLNGTLVIAGQDIAIADIIASNLVFAAVSNTNGANYDNFNFSVKDSSGLPATEFDLAPNTITFNVTPTNDPPTGQDKTITAIEDIDYILTVADFGFADIDTGDSLSGVRIDSLPTNGTLELNSVPVTAGQIIATADITANKLIFTTALNGNGDNYANFTFSVKDSSGDLATQFDTASNTITFDITAKNDPPTGQDKTITAIEDTDYALTVADFGFADIDTGDNLSGVRIDTFPSNGTLKLNGTLVTAGQIITTANITAGNLIFTAAPDANGSNYSNFNFSVRDSSGDGATQFDIAPNKITFNVTPANDPPTGQDKTISSVEDTPYVFTTNDFGFSDIDTGDILSDVRIDTQPASGTFKFSGIEVVVGQIISSADITAGKLIFTPAANATGNNSFNFSVRDNSGDSATEFDSVPNTIILNVLPDNDPPTGQDRTISTVEDTVYLLTTNDFGFSDIDSGDTLSGVRIDTLPNGTLELNGILVMIAQVISAGDIAAGNLVFTPAVNTSGNDAFTFSVKDSSGNIVNEFDTAPNTLTFNVTSANDPPSGQDNAIASFEDTPYIFTTSDFGFSDVDPGDFLSSVRIDTPPASGTFTLDGIAIAPGQIVSAADIAAGKLAFTSAPDSNGNDNAAFTFSVRDSSGDSATEFDPLPNTIIFNVAPINDSPTGQDKAIVAVEDVGYPLTTADFGFSDIDPGDTLSGVRIDSLPIGTLKLNGTGITVGQVISTADIIAGNLTFTSALNSTSNDNFTFSVKDSSGDIATEFDTAPNTLSFNVTPVNDPPAGQDKTIPTGEDASYIFTTSDFGFSDLDLGDSLSGVRINSLPTSGTFTLNGTPVSVSDIISAADIMAGNLIFTPAANITGSNTFTFSVRDSSGDPVTEFDLVPNTITLNVSPTNDPPTGQDKAISIVEDTGYPLTTADFGFSDVDPSDTLSGVRIDTLPTNGTFTLNGAPITIGQVINSTDIAADKLIFTPAPNANESTNFTFSVKDSSSDPASEFDPTPNQITFNVAPVKDAPTGQDKTISATGGIGYPLTINDFGFADADDDTFSGIRIDTIPTNGTFQLNGTNVTAGQVISATEIAADKLVFTIAPGTNGNNYANFTFSVKDNSGDTATEFDAIPNTITFNVASNLAPIIDLDSNDSSGITGTNYQVLYTPGQLAKIGDTDVRITDVDDSNMESAIVTLTTRFNGASEGLVLTGTLPRGINASAYDPLTGILKLTGSASIADYQAAIASITYKNTIVAKNTSNRTVTVIVNDGEKDSSIATTTILFDSDGDRSSDSSDLDDDNDGIPDLIEQNGNPSRDTDGDGILDTLDLDADNDGITDLQESGLSTATIAILDKDNDGVIDPINNFGSNGLSNSLETTPDSGVLNYTPIDTDGDKKPNFQDLDSDNDGLSDLAESGSGYLDGNGDKMVDGSDSDGDGILDLADKGAGFGGGNRPPFKDSNNNGTPDFMEISVSPPKGTNGSDTIIGTDGDDILNGFSDRDIIYGRGGNDLINGGSDRDVLRGDEGNDTINGGTDNDDIQGGTGNDSISGGDGDDLILGNDGDDVLNGDRGKDRIYGGEGKDIINGGDGNDRLHGDEGDDIIRGYRGNDLLIGGLGKDVLTGGQGRDIFRYRSVKEFNDVITDFEIVKDRFDLRKIFNRRGSMSNIELQQSGKDTLIDVSFKGKEYTLGMLEDVNANTLKARHFKF